MAALDTPIIGNPYVYVNQTTILSNSTLGGSWSTSDIRIADIDVSTGIVTGVANGVVTITYTSLAGHTAVFYIQCQPYQITNGYNNQLVITAASNRLCWKSQGSSDSGRFYEDFHAICDENIIKQLQPTVNPTNPQYYEILSSLNRSVILEAINSIFNQYQLVDKQNLVYFRTDYNLYLQPITNQGYCCGIRMDIASPQDTNFAISVKNIILFFSKAITFTMYLYNDMIVNPIASFDVTTDEMGQVTIPVTGAMLLNLNYLSPLVGGIKGGSWFLSYFQDDIQALGATAMYYNIWQNRFKAANFYPFSAPVVVDVYGNRNFQRNIIGANNIMYGINLEIITYIDPTESIVQGLSSGLFDDLLGKIMISKMIEMVLFSYRNNKVQVNIQGNDVLDKLYIELNSKGGFEDENNISFSAGIRERIEQAKRVVKKGFQPKNRISAGCG